VNLENIPIKLMHPLAETVPPGQPQHIKAQPIASIVNRGLMLLGDSSDVNFVTLVPSPIAQNQQPVEHVQKESMQKI
jgi:hypothetical protein